MIILNFGALRPFGPDARHYGARPQELAADVAGGGRIGDWLSQRARRTQPRTGQGPLFVTSVAGLGVSAGR